VYPDVETLVEAGYPQLSITGYYAVVGPAGLPRPILERLNTEVRRAVGSPDVRDILTREGTEPVTTTPAELAALMKKEIAAWRSAMQVTGIREK
jgi:tripartite-type tricarboxylate transporter receptor subunit TctC